MTYRLTLSETETSLRKAARAVGLDWGLAEEAGKRHAAGEGGETDGGAQGEHAH